MKVKLAIKKKKLTIKKGTVDTEFLIRMARATLEEALRQLRTDAQGLTDAQVEERTSRYGRNDIAREKPPRWYTQLVEATDVVCFPRLDAGAGWRLCQRGLVPSGMVH